ncbi:homing endonuclease [Salmonella phage Mutine]|uniref:Homing endonuclease n=1 Tax=Salmonella phage Mutine TaxID=2054274 RepID=A0A2H5BPM0_9CAUD|nr:homing endonuclease [Salmonella phage Mutine]AUG88274.1 homing endonuclease [Salmonella phage Mutine]
MNYQFIYDSLILKAKLRVLDGYSETHHVIPKCMGGSDERHNLVELTPEEHFVAHQLLVKIFPHNHKLAFAANAMCLNNGKVGRTTNNKLFGWLRRKLSDSNKQMYKDNPHLRELRSIMMKRTHQNNPQLRKAQSERLKKKGIFVIQPPWKSNCATQESLMIWKNADKYYDWWKVNKKGYTVMAKAFGFKGKTTPHENMIKKLNPVGSQEKIKNGLIL